MDADRQLTGRQRAVSHPGRVEHGRETTVPPAVTETGPEGTTDPDAWVTLITKLAEASPADDTGLVNVSVVVVLVPFTTNGVVATAVVKSAESAGVNVTASAAVPADTRVPAGGE